MQSVKILQYVNKHHILVVFPAIFATQYDYSFMVLLRKTVVLVKDEANSDLKHKSGPVYSFKNKPNRTKLINKNHFLKQIYPR